MHHADAGGEGFARRTEMHPVAINTHFTFIVGIDTGDDLHGSGLASTVFTDETMNLASPQHQINILQRRDAAK